MRDQGDGDSIDSAATTIFSSPDDAERLILNRLWLRSCGLFEEHFGDLATAYILMAVGLGRLNKNPVDISTISAITGISRPTVRRKVLALQEAGMLVVETKGNRTLVLSTPETVRASEALTRSWKRLVQQAARELSTLDA